MNVEINNMKLYEVDDVGAVAWFWCKVDGWAIHGCHIARGKDGFLRVAAPRGSSRSNSVFRRAVEPPREVWMAIVHAALDEYARLSGGDAEPDNAGLKRVLCAGGKESLERAGI